MTRVAAVDLGTNTVRMMVAEPGEGGFTTLLSRQIITRMGEGLHDNGKLNPQAIERTAGGVTRLLKEAERFAPDKVLIASTSAGRDASNVNELDGMIRSATGHGLTVISWEREANLALRGAMLALDGDVKNFVLFDIGGGSTEYILARNGKLAGAHGTNLGVVRLAETYITKHPVIDEEYAHMAEEVDAAVAEAFKDIGNPDGATLVGTAGTVTSLAAIALDLEEYSAEAINNYKMTAEFIESERRRLSAMTIPQRSQIHSLKDGREDLIIPGFAIIQATLKSAKADHMLVSDYGLREGLVMELLES